MTSVRLPRNSPLIHPVVSIVSIPLTLVLLGRILRLPRLPSFGRRVGLLALIAGMALSSWTALLFVTRGQGTPDPENPPQVLVEEGPYRYTRNPMWAGGFLMVAGAGLFLRSLLVLLYVPTFFQVAQVYLERTEEPELVARFGGAYLDYQRRVPRWLPWPRKGH